MYILLHRRAKETKRGEVMKCTKCNKEVDWWKTRAAEIAKEVEELKSKISIISGNNADVVDIATQSLINRMRADKLEEALASANKEVKL
jgi:hypothetical protein